MFQVVLMLWSQKIFMHFFHARRKNSSFYVVVSAGLGHEDRISSRLWGWQKSIRNETAEKDAKTSENKGRDGMGRSFDNIFQCP